MVGWSSGGLVGWWVGRLIDRLAGLLVGELIRALAALLAGYGGGWSVALGAGWLFSWLAGWSVADSGRAGWMLGRVLVGCLREDCLAAFACGWVCLSGGLLWVGFGVWFAVLAVVGFVFGWWGGWYLWIVGLSLFLAGGWCCRWLGVLFRGRVALLVGRLHAVVRTFVGWLCEWVLWDWVGGHLFGMLWLKFACGVLLS